jgi:hypothetical protein
LVATLLTGACDPETGAGLSQAETSATPASMKEILFIREASNVSQFVLNLLKQDELTAFDMYYTKRASVPSVTLP